MQVVSPASIILRCILILFLAVAVAAPTCFTATTISLVPNAGPVPPSYFCLNILFHPLTHVPWPSIPFGGWRLSHVNWADLEPQKDNWNFALLDRYADWGQQHHTEILMALTYTPRWASSSPDAPTDVETGNPPGLSGPPSDIEDWKTFVRTVATRYKGRIHVYEIWNEPNRPQSWVGDVNTMVVMTREARKILKEIDSNNIVVAPAPEEQKGLSWFKEFLQDGGARYVDVIGYHFYVGEQPPEAMVPLIEAVRSMMDQYHASRKPLWNTEAGWLGAPTLPPALAAAYVARAYVLNWAAGVSRFYWYAWDIHHGSSIELTEMDNTTLTRAGNAYQTVERWTIGSVLNRCVSSNEETWICDLQNNGIGTHIVWSTNGDTVLEIPSTWNASSVETLSGNHLKVRNRHLIVGIEPVLIN